MPNTSKKQQKFALVPGHGWLVIDHVVGTPRDGRPWFIGIGQGFDVSRFLVYANGSSDAEEILEEKFPDRLGEKLSRAEARKAEENGEGVFYSGPHTYRYREVRINRVAKQVRHGAIQLGSEAKLKSGKTIRYTSPHRKSPDTRSVDPIARLVHKGASKIARLVTGKK